MLAGWCLVVFQAYQVTQSGYKQAGSIGFSVASQAVYPVSIEGVGEGNMTVHTDGTMSLYSADMGQYRTGTVHGSAVVPLR